MTENAHDTSWSKQSRQDQERFRLMVDSVRDYAIFSLDPEGRIVSWNEGARRINGYESHEIIGSHFSRFYPEEDIRNRKPERELEIARAEGRVEDEGWRLRKDGSRFWADVIITALYDPVTHELRGYGKVTRDLTERKLAEERMRQSEEQFRLLVESVHEYAIFMLDPTGHVATWNSGAEKAKGYKVEEIIGEHFERFYTPADRAAGLPQRLLEIARRQGSVRHQGVRVRKDGSIFQAEVLLTAVYDSTGTLRGFSKVTRDITDQVRTREAEAARIAAERANKAKDDFLAVLSHELRTPLTPVIAGASYLSENLGSISEQELKEEVGAIRRNAMLEAQLIDDLLDLTRISRGKIELHFEATDLHSAIQDGLAILKEEIARKQLQVEASLRAALQWVWADPVRLRQVFWNLLNNAVKFTPAKGRLIVRTASLAGGALVAEVTDTGVGIEPEQVSRIFDAFEQGERTVTRQFGGLGLGLAISRSLVQMHHGSITAESAGRGKGATFRVVFPTIPQPKTTPEQARAAIEPSPGYRILLVDDHDDTRRVLSRLLSRQGHEVRAAGNVSAALTMLRAEQFDFLLSDIGLPDGSGHELMVQARKVQPSIQGIALSGFGMEDDLARSERAGFKHHLTKPVDLQSLQELIAKLTRQ